MKIILHFRHHIEPSKEIEKYIKQKISKLVQFNKDIMEVHIDISGGKEHRSPDKYRISVTLHLPPKHILHAEVKGSTAEATADIVYDVMKRQIEKHTHKNRLSHKEREERKIIEQFPPGE